VTAWSSIGTEGDRLALHSGRTPPHLVPSARNQADSVEAPQVSIPAASTIFKMFGPKKQYTGDAAEGKGLAADRRVSRLGGCPGPLDTPSLRALGYAALECGEIRIQCVLARVLSRCPPT